MKTIITSIAALLLTSSVAYSQVPHQINMQSLIFDEDGNITTSDFVDLTVRILDEQNNVMFFEQHNDVPVLAGAVQIAIGSQNILDLDALDPATGPKVMDVLVDGTNPFELLPLGAVPYSMWAERAVSVVEDSIESQHIKNGTIKVEDLEPGLAFSNIQGQASDNQIPSSMATDAELNAHVTSSTAHPASAIVLSGQFATFVGNNIQDAIRGLDSRLRDEIVFRQNGVNALNNTVAGIQTHLSNNMMDKRGATMSGPLTFNDAGCVASTGQVCTVDGVDVSALANTVQNTQINQMQGQVTEAQVPQFMRPVAFGTVTVSSCAGHLNGLHTIGSFTNAYNSTVPIGGPIGGPIRVSFVAPVSVPYTIVTSSSDLIIDRDQNGFDVSTTSLCTGGLGGIFDFVVFKN